MTTLRLGERKRIPIQRVERPSYRRPMQETRKIDKAALEVCGACEGAFLHYRQCPFFTGADQLKIRVEAARAAKARVGTA